MRLDPRIEEQFDARAPFRLRDATLLMLTQVGSHSHGTYIQATDPNAVDDVDFMGIVVPPLSYTMGIKSWEGVNFQHEELDVVFYSFRKFTTLLCRSNPNVLGLLWTRPECVLVRHEAWLDLVHSRHLFATKAAHGPFAGYADGQFKKMTSYTREVQAKWDRAVALVTAAGWTVADVVASKNRGMPNVDAVLAAITTQPPTTELLQAFDDLPPATLAQAELQNAVADIVQIHAKYHQGYMGEKRKRLVRQVGYDAKNAGHLIRLMRMCVEFLQTGNMQVYRTTDADEIRDIKSGGWPLELVQAEAERLFVAARNAKAVSQLPEEIDLEAVDRLVKQVHQKVYNLVAMPFGAAAGLAA